jgi:hypothetical protein
MPLRAIITMVAGTFLVGASPAGAGSLEDCGQRVIRDWYSGGRVDKVYPLPCYRAAIRALPDDVLQYTDAPVAIERALQSAKQGTTGKPTTTPDDAPSAPTPATTSKAPTPTTASRPAVRPASAPPHDPTRLASGPAAETHEPGVPYPLIALAALSLVLLASGIAAGLAHRRR